MATWVNIGYICLHELTGINVIRLYSNKMFTVMQQDGNSSVSPRTGVYIVGIVYMFAGLTSSLIVKRFGRRPILICGHLAMTVMHAAVSVFNDYNQDNLVLVMVLLFMVSY